MDNNQRELVVTEIKKYNDEIDQIKKVEILNIIGMTIGTTVTAYLASIIDSKDILATFVIHLTLLGINSFYLIKNASELLNNIARRAGLKVLIRDLESQVQIDELNNEKSRGK